MERGVQKKQLEYATCRTCDDPIIRVQGALLWEHALDVRLDSDHVPRPEADSLVADEPKRSWSMSAPDIRLNPNDTRSTGFAQRVKPNEGYL